MDYTLPIDGISRHKVTMRVEGVFAIPKLYVDGQLAESGPKKNLYLLPTDEKDEKVVAWVRRGVFDPSPVVSVSDQEIGIAEPFSTWTWLWLLVPVVVSFILWQLLGLAIGVWVMFFNGRILRLPSRTPMQRNALTVLVTVLGLVVAFLAVSFFRLYIPFSK